MATKDVEVVFQVVKHPQEKPKFVMMQRKIKVIYEMTQDEMDQALEQFNLSMKYEANQM